MEENKNSVQNTSNPNIEISPFWKQATPAVPQEGPVVEVKKPKSFFLKFLIVAVAVFVLAGAFAAYQYFSKNNSVQAAKIALSVDSELFADSGVTKELQFSVSNQNPVAITNVKLDLACERGRTVGGSTEIVRQTFDLGEIKSGSLIATSTSVMLFGEEGDTRNVSITMSYQVTGSNAVYNKSIQNNLKIKAPLVTMELNGPDQIIDDNEFVLEAKIKNVAQNQFVPSLINFELPAGFILKREATSTNQTRIDLDTLALGEERTFKIKGVFKNSIGQTRTFRVYASAKSDVGEGVQYASAHHEMAVNGEPMTVTSVLKVDNREAEVATLNKVYSYEIKFVNNGAYAVDDLVINIDSGTNKYSKTYENTDELKRLNPDAAYSMLLDEPAQNMSKKDYKIEVYAKQKGTFDTVLMYKGTLTVNFK